MPFIVTEPGMNVVPAGISSLKITSVTGTFPEFVMTDVYVSVSPLTAKALSTLFITDISRSIIKTVAGFELEKLVAGYPANGKKL